MTWTDEYIMRIQEREETMDQTRDLAAEKAIILCKSEEEQIFIHSYRDTFNETLG